MKKRKKRDVKIRLVHLLKIAQRAFSRAMPEVSLKNKILKEVIHQRTKVVDIACRILKWQWASHICRTPIIDGGIDVSSGDNGSVARSVGDRLTRCIDGLRKPAGCREMRQTQDWAKSRREVYVQQWTEVG